MELKLSRAKVSEAEVIFNLQHEAFLPLLEKYKDYDTNPANESIEKVVARIMNPRRAYYMIRYNEVPVGAIGVRWDETESHYWISPIFVISAYQGLGIAQQTINTVESMYPMAETWELATILEETRNCYLYEKIGYRTTGATKRLNEFATLVFYQKMQSSKAVEKP